MKQFEHGGDIQTFAQQLKCKQRKIIDLSSNINFIKPKTLINFNTLDISAYPNYTKLYKKIAKNYKVKPKNIELFNGGSSAIFTLFRHLNLKKCTIYSPAYLEYKKAAIIHEYKIELINRFDDIYKEVEKNSFVVFVNPSTPDGMYYNLDRLMKQWISKKCTILIDESFLDFTNKSSAIKYLKEYDKLYILKSMTKFYSSAGIRMGTIISKKKNIKSLQQNEPMWKLSQFDMSYLLQVLGNKNFIKKTIQINKENKKELIYTLKKSSVIEEVYPSFANYVLVKLKKIDASTLQEKLKAHKIMIRDCSNFDFLDDSYVRIAVKNRKSITQLKMALKEF